MALGSDIVKKRILHILIALDQLIYVLIKAGRKAQILTGQVL